MAHSKNPTKIDSPGLSTSPEAESAAVDAQPVAPASMAEPETAEPGAVAQVAEMAQPAEVSMGTPEVLVGAAAARKDVEKLVVEALETIFDPEIPVNIYALGLIYSVDVVDDGAVIIQMTLTSPACPVAGSLPGEVQQKAASVPGVHSAEVDLVWDPVWNPDMMSEAARLELGLF